MSDFRTYRVQRGDRKPLLDFMLAALRAARCRILFSSEPDVAPFRITFETPDGERIGIVAYAFLANSKVTRNRPQDEHRLQVKYGSKDGKLHPIWQDPYELYVTLFLGINPDLGFFVGADPVLHDMTKFFISIEFKQAQVDRIRKDGWISWERERRADREEDSPVEVLVGGTADSFLRYVYFERQALREDQGHRQLLAERPASPLALPPSTGTVLLPGPAHLHQLATEFQLSEEELLNLIQTAPRLRMAVRGWVAEEHLRRQLTTIRDVTECKTLTIEGGADIALRFQGVPLTVECKNVLRQKTKDGAPRMDFQRTRASKKDPCSRYYRPSDFDLIAACLHAVTERWEFRYAVPWSLAAHKTCTGRLSSNVTIDNRWTDDPHAALTRAASRNTASAP